MSKEIGIESPKIRGKVNDLISSGYVRMEMKSAVLLIDFADIGPKYLPGHAHADSLSFELSLFKQRIFVNSGVSTYASGRARHFERSTAAHNTVTVDKLDSSEVWSSFRVGRKAKVFNRKSIFNPRSPWISNTAVGQLLFKDEKKFQKHFPQYLIKENRLSEFFIFLNSGGVNSSFFYIKLSSIFLKILNLIDKILIFFLPNIFALNRTVVLKKTN